MRKGKDEKKKRRREEILTKERSSVKERSREAAVRASDRTIFILAWHDVRLRHLQRVSRRALRLSPLESEESIDRNNARATAPYALMSLAPSGPSPLPSSSFAAPRERERERKKARKKKNARTPLPASLRGVRHGT